MFVFAVVLLCVCVCVCVFERCVWVGGLLYLNPKYLYTYITIYIYIYIYIYERGSSRVYFAPYFLPL